MAQNEAHHVRKDSVEKDGGPLHFPSADELNMTDSMKQTVIDAKKASDSEQNMTLLQGIKLYPKVCKQRVRCKPEAEY